MESIIATADHQMYCWHCRAELIWGGDHDLEEEDSSDYDMITNLSCPKCDSYVEVYHKREETT